MFAKKFVQFMDGVRIDVEKKSLKFPASFFRLPVAKVQGEELDKFIDGMCYSTKPMIGQYEFFEDDTFYEGSLLYFEDENDLTLTILAMPSEWNYN